MRNEIGSGEAAGPVDWIERGAVGASFLCLVHCLALPFLLAALPALATALPVSERFHIWIIAFAVPTSAVALWTGWFEHGAVFPVLVGGVGLGLLAIGAFVFGETFWEIPVTVCGSLILAAAHLRNWRLRHNSRPVRP